MDPTPPRGRQTAVIDDAQALAMGELTQKTKKNKVTTSRIAPNIVTVAPKRIQKSATKSHNLKTATNDKYYEGDGLKIPYYDKAGKRRPGARLAKSLAQRVSKEKLLETVKEYAGESKFLAMQNMANKDIAQWIEEVETKALGENKKKQKSEAAARTTEHEVNAHGPSENAIEPTLIVNASPTANGQKYRTQSRKTAKRSQAHANLAHQNFTNAPLATSLSADTSPLTTMNGPISLAGFAEGISTRMSSSFLTTPPAPSAPAKKRSQDMAGFTEENTNKRKRLEDPSPTTGLRRPKKAKKSVKETTPVPGPRPATQFPEQPGSFPIPLEESDQYLEELVTRLLEEEHEVTETSAGSFGVIDELDLDSSYALTTTVMVDLPEHQEKAVITATSETAVHETQISYAPPVPQPPTPRPYLKAGRHGWDYDLHRWGFHGDRDLETGRGHQIEPADQERLDKNPSFEREFKKKYPGVLAGQWPCGCQTPWSDEDSEEE